MEAKEASQHIRWRLAIDTDAKPRTELVHVDCPVCGERAHAEMFLNCVVPAIKVTLEEALTAAAEDRAHAVLAQHLIQGDCRSTSQPVRTEMGVLFPDRRAPHVYWLLRNVEHDEDPGSSYYVIERWTGAEIDDALQEAKKSLGEAERKVDRAKRKFVELRELAKASDTIECPF